MRFAWLGFHHEGVSALHALLAAGAPIRVVVTLREDLAARRHDGAEYPGLCARYGVPLYHIANINEREGHDLLRRIAPDIVFVIGWPQVVRPDTLRLARLGMIGAHAAILPHNRGSAPINWAIIHGEPETGSTLFWLSPTSEGCDIIDQVRFPITPYDTSASLYSRVAAANRDMLLWVLPQLMLGRRPGRPQPPAPEPPLPRRRGADGRIDWTQPAPVIYDLIRATTRPYPGAFSALEGETWRIWHAALPPSELITAERPPGEIVGPVMSPVSEACGLLVACGQGTLILLELEGPDGTVLNGRALSEQPWAGRHWRDP